MAGIHRGGHRGLQRLRQLLAVRQQALQRLTHQRKLFGQRRHAVQLATGHGRPRIFGGGHTFARQRQHGGVKTTQARCLVVGKSLRVQLPGLAHGRKPRRLMASHRRLGMAAEKQQVLRQAVRQFGITVGRHTHRGAQLRQQARSQPLDIDITHQQPSSLGLKHRRCELPEGGKLATAIARRAGARGKVGAKVAHAVERATRTVACGLAHQCQGKRFHLAARGVVGVARGGHRVVRQFAPLPILLPQVGRMHAVGPGQQQHRAVLREEHHRRHGLAGQLARQEVEHREGHLLHRIHRRGGHQRRLGRQALHSGFAGAQHIGHRGLAHQFQRTHALVQLRTRAAQHRGVNGVEVAAARGLGFFQVTAQ